MKDTVQPDDFADLITADNPAADEFADVLRDLGLDFDVEIEESEK